MKKLILILTVLTLNSMYAQTWKFKNGGNAFDGKYKTAFVTGKGNNFLYKNPVLVVNLFNDDSLNFYISDSGYYQSEDEMEILWVFDNDSDVIFYSKYFTISKDGKIIFLSYFINTHNDETITKLDFIDKLKLANKVTVRINDKYGKNDIIFNLRGSNKAIEFVISNKYREKKEKEDKELSSEIKKQMRIKGKIYGLIILCEISNKEDVRNIANEIFDMSDIYSYKLSDIEKINIRPSNYNNEKVDIDLFDDKGNYLHKITSFKLTDFSFVDNVKKSEDEYLKNLVSNYIDDETDIIRVSKEISKYANIYTKDVFDIKKIIIKPSSSYTKDGGYININTFDKNEVSLYDIEFFKLNNKDFVNKYLENEEQYFIKLLSNYNFKDSEKKYVVNLIKRDINESGINSVFDIDSVDFKVIRPKDKGDKYNIVLYTIMNDGKRIYHDFKGGLTFLDYITNLKKKNKNDFLVKTKKLLTLYNLSNDEIETFTATVNDMYYDDFSYLSINDISKTTIKLDEKSKSNTLISFFDKKNKELITIIIEQNRKFSKKMKKRIKEKQ